MLRRLFTIFFAVGFVLAASAWASAQLPDASTASGRTDPVRQMDLPTSIKENLAKQRIKSEEKQFRELVERGEEAVRLGAELSSSLETSEQLSAADVKKVERLEKLVKKIRDDLGAEDDDSEKTAAEEKPQSLTAIVKNIKEDTANLLSEIKRIGRHSISVVAIESSNALLKMVRFLRFRKK